MSLSRHLRKALAETNSLCKKDDPEAYKKLADEGLLLSHPVKIHGEDKRSDNGVKYHTSIKFFNKDKDDPKHIHEIASNLGLHPPHPETTEIEPGTIKSRAGDDIHVIKLKGPHIDKLKEHHKKFSHMGHEENYEFHPHISVSKETHDRIKASGAKTAHEAGIEFGHAELKHGPKVLQNYGPKKDKTEKSEDDSKLEPLMKPYTSEAQRRWAHTKSGKKALGGNAGVHEWDEATKGKKLPERVEKSEGLNYTVAVETIFLSSSLSEHKKALLFDEKTLTNYLQDNPTLKEEILKKHEERAYFHFVDDLDLLNIALEKGIQEAYKVKRGK